MRRVSEYLETHYPRFVSLTHITLDLLPLFRLDWGIAGISCSTPEVDYKGEKATHGRWTHWIDSRTQDTESAADEGWMTPLNPERTRMLERGEMENPETCEVTPYEEIWIERSPDNVPGPEKQQCIVLKLDEHGSAKGLIVRTGKICQGILRVGEEIRAERWEWHEGKWLRTKRVMGDEDISVPCERVLDPETQWREQQQIEHQGRRWTAVEVSEI